MHDLPVKNIPTKALVVESQGAAFELKSVILDEVRENEVLIEMKYTGVCHTDIVVQHGGVPEGAFPAILGHEGAGIVRRIGANIKNKSLKPGDPVLLSFHTCRKCSYCSQGRLSMCPSMTEVNFTGVRLADSTSPASFPDGSFVRGQFFGQSSFSKYAIVAEDSVIKCDISPVDLAIMAPLGCGYLTGAGTIFNVVKPSVTSSLAIFGMGGVGLCALMAAKAIGVKRIIAIDILASKLDMALSLGATHVINSAEESDISNSIRKIVATGVENVVDTTGLPKVIEAGVVALGHGGTIALVGVPRPGQSVAFDPLDFLLSCKRMAGVIEAACDPAEVIPQLIQLYREGKFPIDRLGKVYPAESIDQAIKDLHLGAVIKPILSWESVRGNTEAG